MGLTNESPKDTITSLQVLIELAKTVKAVNENPDFDKLAKDAYALPVAEQKKADEARASITKYQDLLAQYKKQATEIEASQDNLDLRTSQIKKAQETIDSQKKDLSAREKTLNENKATHLLNVDTLAKDRAELKKGQDKLEADKADHLLDVKNLEEKEAALKEKSEKLKSLIG